MLLRPTPDGMSGNGASSCPRLDGFRATKQKFSRATSVNIRLDTVGLKRDGVLLLSAHCTTSLLISSRRSLEQGCAFTVRYPLGLEKLKRRESSISVASFRKCLLSGDIDCSRYPLAVAAGNWCSNPPTIRRGIPTGLKPCSPSPVQPCDDSVPGLREPDSFAQIAIEFI